MTVYFYVPLDKYESVIAFFNDEMKKSLIEICDSIMPKKAGLDVKYVDFSPSLEEIQTEKSMIKELEKETLKDIPQELQIKIIPSDIIEKAKDMSQAYTFLNIVENTLRLYIDKKCKELLCDDYFIKLNVSGDMKINIERRKKDEERNQWLRIRGDSDIFYLDFDDLGNLIKNNWILFDSNFPSQEWITTKVVELSKCRNLVAHNSYIGKDELDVIRVNFTQLLKQLSSTS